GINTSNIAETILDYSDTELKTALSNAQPILSNDYTTVTLPDVSLAQLKDNEVVDLGTLRIVNNVGATLISYDVKVKKDLPTRAPTGLKLRTTTSAPPTANWSYDPGTKTLKIMPNGTANPFDAAATTPPVGINYNFATNVIGTITAGNTPPTTNLFDVPRSSSDNTLSAISSADVSISVPDLGSNLKGNALSLNGQYSSTKQYLASAQYNYGDIAYNDGKVGKAHVAPSTEAFILQIGSILETNELRAYFGSTIASIVFVDRITTATNITPGITVPNFRKYIDLNSIIGELVGYSDPAATVAIPDLSTSVTVSGLKNTAGAAQLILTATNTVKDFSADNVRAIRLVLTFEDILGAELTKKIVVTAINLATISGGSAPVGTTIASANKFASTDFTSGVITIITGTTINLPNLIEGTAVGYTLQSVTATLTGGTGTIDGIKPAATDNVVTYNPTDHFITINGDYSYQSGDTFNFTFKFTNAAGDVYIATQVKALS
ncbi:hypothetical protein EZS27_027225, partial [termite gut metagenome]